MVLRESTHPVRMCLGCRERSPKSQLIRVVVRDDSAEPSTTGGPVLVVDHRKNLPGRGAWLHPSEDCVLAAVRRRAFGPALRERGLTVTRDDLAEIFGGAGQEGSAGSQTGE